MATQTINYTDKVFLNENSSIADINKIKDVDMNEIKSVVNNNASETDTNATNITNIQTYSTSETDTGKKWIDGKTIYRKVLDITNISSSGAEYSHNISNLGVIINVYGSWDKTGAGRQPLTRVVPGAISQYGVGIGDITDTKFKLHYGSSVSGVTHIYVVFEYTKTS